MTENNRVRRFLLTNQGKYLDIAIDLAINLLIIIGFSTLFIASMLAEPYMWGGEFPSGGYWDAWGVRIYPGFYEALDLAVSLLIIASLLYPVRLWFDDIGSRKLPEIVRDVHVYAGLLLPSIVSFGQITGHFYPEGGYRTLDLGFTGIASPLYNFVFTGNYELDASIVFAGLPSPLLLLSVIFFVLGIGQILAWKAYEKKQIKIRLFLVPVLASLIVSILIFGSSFPSLSYSLYGWYLYPHFADICFAIPMLTIGVLVKAIGNH